MEILSYPQGSELARRVLYQGSMETTQQTRYEGGQMITCPAGYYMHRRPGGSGKLKSGRARCLGCHNPVIVTSAYCPACECNRLRSLTAYALACALAALADEQRRPTREDCRP